MKLIIFVGAMALVCCGCTHYHLSRNAPGIIDIHTPPENMACAVPDRPDDPGEYFFTISPGLLTDLGSRFDSSRVKFQGSLGTELGLQWGKDRSSHGDGIIPIIHPSPDLALGINIGWMFLHASQGMGPLYLEAQWRHQLIGVALGWAWERATRQSGPQTTLFYGPIYARATILHHRTDVLLGFILKFPVTLVWSQ